MDQILDEMLDECRADLNELIGLTGHMLSKLDRLLELLDSMIATCSEFGATCEDTLVIIREDEALHE